MDMPQHFPRCPCGYCRTIRDQDKIIARMRNTIERMRLALVEAGKPEEAAMLADGCQRCRRCGNWTKGSKTCVECRNIS